MNDNILLVDDDPRTIQIMGRILAPQGNLRFATSGQEALRLAHESPPDLVLLDADMPEMSGFEVCAAMKAEPALSDVPVIFVTNHHESAFEVTAFELGAVDFIAKPVSAPLVLARVRTQLRLKRLADELRRTATTDGLTGVANRRQFDDVLEREWMRARRTGHALALLMIDVDHFKLYNDRYGHQSGDACLRKVARALIGASLRPADVVARYGGEEFALLLPLTPRAGAELVGQRILGAIEALAIPHDTSPTAPHLTVSVGVSCYDDASECWTGGSSKSDFADDLRPRWTAADLVRAADTALYAAKHAGRAQAGFLDAAHIYAPQVADDIALLSRRSRSTEWS